MHAIFVSSFYWSFRIEWRDSPRPLLRGESHAPLEVSRMAAETRISSFGFDSFAAERVLSRLDRSVVRGFYAEKAKNAWR
jgi:hypothetical protein